MKKQCSAKAFLIMNMLLVLNLLIFWSIRYVHLGLYSRCAFPRLTWIHAFCNLGLVKTFYP